MSDALEALLHKHSALSVGDWLSLEHGDSRFDLRVLELQPTSSVSVIGGSCTHAHRHCCDFTERGVTCNVCPLLLMSYCWQ